MFHLFIGVNSLCYFKLSKIIQTKEFYQEKTDTLLPLYISLLKYLQFLCLLRRNGHSLRLHI
jgi:hypothetical protein